MELFVPARVHVVVNNARLFGWVARDLNDNIGVRSVEIHLGDIRRFDNPEVQFHGDWGF
jgi:hypothetical protein